MKRIIITGGAGFIGSHLCDKLLQEGNEVFCIDDLSTGSLDNIKHLSKNHNFIFVEHDIREPLYLWCNEIYNLASPASPVQYQNDPIKTFTTNVEGSIHMLNLATAIDAKILQASTSEVYGDPQQTPQNEIYWGNVNPIGIRSCYDEGKRCVETLFFDYWRQYKTNIKIVRIFNTYGPRMSINDGRVVSNLIVQSLKNQDLSLYGDGTHTRSFCYIDDMVDGLIRMMKMDDFVGPVNLGNPSEITILKLSNIINDLTGSSSKQIFFPLPIDDPKQRCPDINLAKEKLNWSPTTFLEDGLGKTIDYFKSVL